MTRASTQSMCEWEGKDGLLLERHFHLGAFTILELKTALKKMKFFFGGGVVVVAGVLLLLFVMYL